MKTAPKMTAKRAAAKNVRVARLTNFFVIHPIYTAKRSRKVFA